MKKWVLALLVCICGISFVTKDVHAFVEVVSVRQETIKSGVVLAENVLVSDSADNVVCAIVASNGFCILSRNISSVIKNPCLIPAPEERHTAHSSFAFLTNIWQRRQRFCQWADCVNSFHYAFASGSFPAIPYCNLELRDAIFHTSDSRNRQHIGSQRAFIEIPHNKDLNQSEKSQSDCGSNQKSIHRDPPTWMMCTVLVGLAIWGVGLWVVGLTNYPRHGVAIAIVGIILLTIGSVAEAQFYDNQEGQNAQTTIHAAIPCSSFRSEAVQVNPFSCV